MMQPMDYELVATLRAVLRYRARACMLVRRESRRAFMLGAVMGVLMLVALIIAVPPLS